MKKRRLQIKIGLFISLALILGVLLTLFLVFCRGKDYNKLPIPTKPETTTEAPTEVPTEPITEELVTESESEEVSEESTEEVTESTTEPSMNWASYNPTENLAGENWALTLISSAYKLDKSYLPTLSPVVDNSSVTADTRVSEAYKKMYGDAQSQGIVLTPYSGYCSFQRQQSNFNNKVQAFVLQGMTQDEATQNAEKRIQQGGCSENNAGLAVDIISASAGFASTNEFKWLTENAHKYGFVLRYPEDKVDITGIIYQPWHWRFVGVDAAAEMKANNQCLEEYLKAQ